MEQIAFYASAHRNGAAIFSVEMENSNCNCRFIDCTIHVQNQPIYIISLNRSNAKKILYH